MPARIEDYALIGDLQTAALVSCDGSIDWCCMPRFDSGACFAALLGTPEHGRWRVAPVGAEQRWSRSYRQSTLILESEVTTPTGRVRLIDFMPPRDEDPNIVRIVEGLAGEVAMVTELTIRFDYGNIVPWVRRIDEATVAIAGPDGLAVRSPVELHGENLHTVGMFTVRAGERTHFTATWFPSARTPPVPVAPLEALAQTEAYWRDWTATCCHAGEYREEVLASLRVLKALTYAPTGGVVAAPTTSLPEHLGGRRNWDYRFCWLRDAALTTGAMLDGGSRAEAESWLQWLLRAVAGDPADLQIMYGLAGERRLDERELEWLPGFAGSQPVRVGNAASTQLQLDVYGEVADAVCAARTHGIEVDPDTLSLLVTLLSWLEDGWRLPDAGLWEVRGPSRHFTHSKVMAWVAFDRGVRSRAHLPNDVHADRWAVRRDEIRGQVLTRAWNGSVGAFTQFFGSDELDASTLRIPIVGFLPAEDPRVVATVDAVMRELLVDGLVIRYRPRTDGALDGLPEPEGAFLPCSFWLVEALAMQGRDREARTLFERLLTLRNGVGLLSEEYDPVTGRQLGNMPQAFSHLALIHAALAIERATSQ